VQHSYREESKRGEKLSHFVIEPQDVLIDQAIEVKLYDLVPGSTVVVRIEFVDDREQTWVGQASFIADSDGSIDLASAKPIDGTYEEPAMMAIFWSVQPQAQDNAVIVPFLFSTTRSLKPLIFRLTATVNGSMVAMASLTRRFFTEAVERIDIRKTDLVATLFRPRVGNSRSAAITLGGSGGGFGWARQIAALLASYGQEAMAVAYFDWIGQDDLPRELVEIPLETIKAAIAYFQAESPNALDDLTILGYSKGAEMALLAATAYRDIGRVVAFMPSNVVWEGVCAQPSHPRSSWCYQGKPLPFIPNSIDDNYYANMVNVIDHLVQSGTEPTRLADAAIPVEKIRGSILLISASDDRTWPSAAMADLTMARLQQHRHPFASEHLCLQSVGHTLGLPYLPHSPIAATDVTKMATAVEQGWQAVKRFMNLHKSKQHATYLV
jgi:dienelactone hydrolase